MKIFACIRRSMRNIGRTMKGPMKRLNEKVGSFFKEQNLKLWSLLPPYSLCIFIVYNHLAFNIGGMLQLLIGSCFLVTLLIILFVIFLNAQDMLLYFPEEPSDARTHIICPALLGLPYESLTVTTSDGIKLHSFLIKQANSLDVPTVIMFHGNAGNVGHRLHNASMLYHECKVNVFLLEYRGYGLSGGFISEEGLYKDGIAAVRYVNSRDDLNRSRVVLHGRSLGGAVAIDCAGHPECSDLQAVLLENTFTSLPAIAQIVVNISIIKMLPLWCFKNKYRTDEKIQRLHQPVLFLTGRSDKLVPPFMMDQLHRLCGSRIKQMSSFPKGTHNETFQEPGYFYTIAEFLNRTRSRQTQPRPTQPF